MSRVRQGVGGGLRFSIVTISFFRIGLVGAHARRWLVVFATMQPAPAATDVEAPSSRVSVLETGAGFVRLEFTASHEPGASLYGYYESGLVGIPLEGAFEHEVVSAHEAGSMPRANVRGGAVGIDGPVSVGEAGFVRDQRVVPLGFGPRRNDDGTVTLFDRVVVDVRFAPSSRTARPQDSFFEGSYRASVLNYEQAKHWRRRRDRLAARPARDVVLPGDGMVRLTTRETGMHRVFGQDLAGAGVLLPVASDRLRMFYGGGEMLGRAEAVHSGVELREQAMVVDDGGDGLLHKEDSLLFFAESTEAWVFDKTIARYRWRRNDYTLDNVYWIDLDADQPPLRLSPHSATLQDRPDTVINSHRERLHLEEESAVLIQLFGIRSGYDWYWENFTGNARNYSIFADDPIADAPVIVRLAFWGRTVGAHTMDIRWNERTKAQFRFLGADRDSLELVIDEGAVPGLNRLELVHRDPNLTSLDWLQVEYDRVLRARDGNVSFDARVSRSLVVEFQMTGFDDAGKVPRIFAVNDSGTAEVVGAARVDDSVRFQDRLAAGEERRYVALSDGAWQRPHAIKIDSQSPLRLAVSGADYVIISHPDFLSAAARLAAWRATDDRFGPPFEVALVDVEDIYDEFSGGLLDPMAIRSFVSFAVANWDPAPTFITLIGDGTYDYKNHRGNSHTNWIPPFQDGQSTYDEWYVRISGADDLPDLAVGRLPVQSAAEAEAVVDKLIAYDRSPEPGLWQGRVLLVADDLVNPSEPHVKETYFMLEAEFLAGQVLPADLDLVKLYIAAFPLEGRSKSKARDAFVDLFNSGALLLTYLGHGNPTVLAHEQIFLVSRDLEALNNGARLPFVYTAASQVGVFDDPDLQSMPEVLVNLARGGAIGFISATRVGFHASNIVLSRQFHRQMFRSGRGFVPVGLALMEAKQRLSATDEFRENIQRYSLFGDPGLRLNRPAYRIELQVPEELSVLQEVEVTGQIIRPSGEHDSEYTGTALIQAFDSATVAELDGIRYLQQGAAIFRGWSEVVNGRLSGRFRVPKDVNYGAQRARVSVFAWRGGERDAAHGFVDELGLHGTAEVESDEDGPTIVLGFAGIQAFRSGDQVPARTILRASFSDPGGINITGDVGHQIEIRIDGGDPIIATDGYTAVAGSYTEGTLDFALPRLAVGEHEIALRAWDAFNNSASASTRVRVAEEKGALRSVLFFPNPSADGHGHFTYFLASAAQQVTIRVFTVSGRRVDEIAGNVQKGDHQIAWTPSGLAGGTYLFQVTAELAKGKQTRVGVLLVIPR